MAQPEIVDSAGAAGSRGGISVQPILLAATIYHITISGSRSIPSAIWPSMSVTKSSLDGFFRATRRLKSCERLRWRTGAIGPDAQTGARPFQHGCAFVLLKEVSRASLVIRCGIDRLTCVVKCIDEPQQNADRSVSFFPCLCVTPAAIHTAKADCSTRNVLEFTGIPSREENWSVIWICTGRQRPSNRKGW